MKRRLLEIDKALTGASLIHANLFQPPWKASRRKGGGWGRKRERRLWREGKGLPLPFPFAFFYVHVSEQTLQTNDLFFKFCGVDHDSAGRSGEEGSRDNKSVFQSP